jgi:asparagine synthase (glutamine-hydrolysing)
MEEPVCEPPAIALHYVSHLARNHVKVLLSGEGGDEAFGGYNEYRNLGFFESLKRQLGPLNPTASWALKGAGRMFGSNRAKKYAPLFTSPLSEYYLSRTSSPFSCFNRSKATLYSENFFARAGNGYSTAVTRELFKRVASKDLLSQMLYIDTKTWLPDDLLIKADKITMANSLELRVPLLDHKVLEFAAKLPPEFKVRGLSCKRVLKVALRDRVPREILDRKKTGFPVPYGKWLNGELKDYVRDILSSKRCAERGFFRRGTVDGLLKTNSLHNGLTKEVFSLLVLELWNLQFIDSRKLEACV